MGSADMELDQSDEVLLCMALESGGTFIIIKRKWILERRGEGEGGEKEH